MIPGDGGRARLAALIAHIPHLDESALAASRLRQDLLTKPPGSLGRLERLATQLAGITGSARPSSLPILHHKIALGTRNLVEAPAMTDEQTLATIGVGAQVFSG